MSLSDHADAETIPNAQPKEQAIRSSKWALLSALSSNSMPTLLALFLAHLLTPEDFGIVGLSIVLVSLMRLVQQAGLDQALIQRELDNRDDADAAFWMNMVFAAALYALLWVIAPYIASYYAEPRTALVLRVLGLQLLFSAAGSVKSSMMVRCFRFRALFYVQTASSATPFAVSIPLAVCGYGYWALIAGLVASSLINTAMLWVFNSWHPRLRFDFTAARRLMQFGGLVLLESLLAWVSLNLDKIIIAKTMGMKALGLYSFAFSIAIMAVSIPLSGITSVALPMLSRMQHDMPAFKKTFLEGTRLVAAYALPAGVGLALLSEPLVRIAFGTKWTGMETILSVLALYSGLGHLWALNADAFKAIGRPDIMPKLYAVQLLVMVPALFASARYGLLWFTITRSLVVCVGALPHTFLAVRTIGVPVNYVCQSCRHQIGATVLMALLLGGLLYFSPFRFSGAANWLMLILMIAAGVLTYLGSLFLFDKAFVISVYSLGKHSIMSGYGRP